MGPCGPGSSDRPGGGSEALTENSISLRPVECHNLILRILVAVCGKGPYISGQRCDVGINLRCSYPSLDPLYHEMCCAFRHLQPLGLGTHLGPGGPAHACVAMSGPCTRSLNCNAVARAPRAGLTCLTSAQSNPAHRRPRCSVAPPAASPYPSCAVSWTSAHLGH